MSPNQHARLAHIAIVVIAALAAFAWQVGVFS